MSLASPFTGSERTLARKNTAKFSDRAAAMELTTYAPSSGSHRAVPRSSHDSCGTIAPSRPLTANVVLNLSRKRPFGNRGIRRGYTRLHSSGRGTFRLDTGYCQPHHAAGLPTELQGARCQRQMALRHMVHDTDQECRRDARVRALRSSVFPAGHAAGHRIRGGRKVQAEFHGRRREAMGPRPVCRGLRSRTCLPASQVSDRSAPSRLAGLAVGGTPPARGAPRSSLHCGPAGFSRNSSRASKQAMDIGNSRNAGIIPRALVEHQGCEEEVVSLRQTLASGTIQTSCVNSSPGAQAQPEQGTDH